MGDKSREEHEGVGLGDGRPSRPVPGQDRGAVGGQQRTVPGPGMPVSEEEYRRQKEQAERPDFRSDQPPAQHDDG